MSKTPRVTLELPVLLEPIVGKTHRKARGRTVSEALEDAYREVPALRHHLVSDNGELRPHVLCLLNGKNVARGEMATMKLADGDELVIHQAISGG